MKWILADSPQTASFLNEEEAKEVQARLAHDNEDLAAHYDTKFMWDAFGDWKIWMQCVLVFPLCSDGSSSAKQYIAALI
jgi:hypothetical protein